MLCISMLLCVALLMPSTVFASSFEDKQYELSEGKLEVSDFITYTEENNQQKLFISQQNLSRIKESLSKQKISKEETYKEIYRGLGYSERQIDAIGMDEIEYMIEEAAEITVNQQYIIIDEDGNQEAVSKEECLDFADKVNDERKIELQKMLSQVKDDQSPPKIDGENVALAAANNSSYNSETKGAMKIMTTSTYLNPSSQNNNKGWYNFSATFDWLTNPSQSWTDAFSLQAIGCAWAQGLSDFTSKMSYTEILTSGGKTTLTNRGEQKNIIDREIEADGVRYHYELPRSYIDQSIGYYLGFNNLTFYIRAKARVSSHTEPYAFNVYSRYEHLTKSIQVNSAFGWKIGSKPGVTVTATVGNNHTEYQSYNYTSYNPRYYK